MKEDADEWGMVPDGCMVKTTVFKGTRWESEISVDAVYWDSLTEEEKHELFKFYCEEAIDRGKEAKTLQKETLKRG